MDDIIRALNSLRPGAEWVLRSAKYSGLEWKASNTLPKPSEQEIIDEITRLKNMDVITEYQRLRAAAYPPITDYLDAVVKSDQAQIDKYIQDCLAVKAQYPKPE